MGPKQRYSEKLKDPRWQKRRLEILERDGWACRKCGDEEMTLHIHHIRYGSKEPWDVPDAWLVTLCADCHEEEYADEQAAMRDLFDAFRMHFWTDEISCFAIRFGDSRLPPINKQERESIILHCIMKPEFIKAAEDEYLGIMRSMWGEDYARDDE